MGPDWERSLIHLCTYFDRNYIHRGLALYRSLEKAAEPFRLWTLALDDETADALDALRLASIRVIRMGRFEGDDPGLEGAKRDRNRVEYYFTCTAPWLLWLFRNVPEAEAVVYVDADVMFFGLPGVVLRELGEGSILLNLHDSSQEYGTGDRSGKFNVGVMAFRRDAEALAALSWWRERCIETCRFDPAAGLYGDQHYLNDWETRFRGVVVGRNPGLRAAPWNIARYRATPDGPEGILLDGSPLVAYHFHSLAFCTRRLVYLAAWSAAIPDVVLERAYAPYLRELRRAEGDLLGHGRPILLPVRGIPWRYLLGRILRRQPLKHFAWCRG